MRQVTVLVPEEGKALRRVGSGDAEGASEVTLAPGEDPGAWEEFEPRGAEDGDADGERGS